MSLESTERAICAELNAADEKVGAAAEACVRAVLDIGANTGIFPVVVDGEEYVVKVGRPFIPSCSYGVFNEVKA